MKIRIPFTDSTLYIGKDAQAAKLGVRYGAYQNGFETMFANAGTYRIGFETLYMLYNSLVDVRRAVKKRQQATMKEGYTLINSRFPDRDPNPEQVQIAEIILNGFTKFTETKSEWIRDRIVAGNSYWHIVKSKGGDLLGIERIDPRTMIVVADKFGTIRKYIQRVAGHDTQTFEPGEILHSVEDYSTTNPLLGASPLEVIVWDGRAELAATMSNHFFFENNAVPSHLLIVDDELTDEQVHELKKAVELQFQGVKNKFKSGIIPGLKDIKTITPSQKDMQYIETRTFNTKKIASATGVDPFLLGYTDAVQYSNASIIRKDFYESTVRPDEVEFEAIMNKKLFPMFGLDEIAFVVYPSNYDDEKQERELARLEVLAGLRTINEARDILDLEPSENEFADELLFNGFLLDDLGEEADQLALRTVESTLEKKKALQNLLR